MVSPSTILHVKLSENDQVLIGLWELPENYKAVLKKICKLQENRRKYFNILTKEKKSIKRNETNPSVEKYTKKIKRMLNDIKEMKVKWTQRQAIGNSGKVRKEWRKLYGMRHWKEQKFRLLGSRKIENAKIHIAHYEKS